MGNPDTSSASLMKSERDAVRKGVRDEHATCPEGRPGAFPDNRESLGALVSGTVQHPSSCRVCGQPSRPDSRYCSGDCAGVERDVWWALVKARELSGRLVSRWARSWLGLDD
jgi:hypothetical protein